MHFAPLPTLGRPVGCVLVATGCHECLILLVGDEELARPKAGHFHWAATIFTIPTIGLIGWGFSEGDCAAGNQAHGILRCGQIRWGDRPIGRTSQAIEG